MVPSLARPVTQKKPTSVMPTLSAAPIRWANCTGSLPVERRLSAPAVEAAAMASRSARAADTGTGAGAPTALGKHRPQRRLTRQDQPEWSEAPARREAAWEPDRAASQDSREI